MDPRSGLRPHQLVHGGDDSSAHGDDGIDYRDTYFMTPLTSLDDNMAHGPSTSEPYSYGFYSPLDGNSLPSNHSIVAETYGYPHTIQNIARFHPSSLYTSLFDSTETASSSPMHPVAVIYNLATSDHQPIWNYYVTHPPSHSGIGVSKITCPHPYTSPNRYIYSPSPVFLAPPVSGPSTRTQAVGKCPTQVSQDEVVVGHRCASVTKQRSVMQVSVEMNKQEHKNALRLFKETPLQERERWPLEVSSFPGSLYCHLADRCARLSGVMYSSLHSTKRGLSGCRENSDTSATVSVRSAQRLRPRCAGYSMNFGVQWPNSRWTHLETL